MRPLFIPFFGFAYPQNTFLGGYNPNEPALIVLPFAAAFIWALSVPPIVLVIAAASPTVSLPEPITLFTSAPIWVNPTIHTVAMRATTSAYSALARSRHVSGSRSSVLVSSRKSHNLSLISQMVWLERRRFWWEREKDEMGVDIIRAIRGRWDQRSFL